MKITPRLIVQAAVAVAALGRLFQTVQAESRPRQLPPPVKPQRKEK